MVCRLKIVLVVALMVHLASCKKNDSTSWSYCTGCTIDEWVGEYNGSGDYYDGSSEETELGVETIVKIENTSGNILKTTVTAVDKIATTFISSKTDDNHYYSVAGNNRSLDLNLSRNGNEYKLSGTVKLFHFHKDTIVIDQSISFEVFK